MTQFIFPPLTASLDSEASSGAALPSAQMIVGGYYASGTVVYPLAVDAAGQLQVDVVSSTGPTGFATSALQTAGNNILTTIDADTSLLAGAISGTELQVDVVAPLPGGTNSLGTVILGAGTAEIGKLAAGTASIGTVGLNGGTNSIGTVILGAGTAEIGKLAAGTASIGSVTLNANSGVDIGDVDVTSSALPSGAATSALQTTANGILTTIDADTSLVAGCVAGTEMQVDVVSGSVVVDTYSIVDFIDSTVAGYVTDNGVIELSGTDTIPAKGAAQLQLVSTSAAAIKKVQTVEDIGEYMGLFTGASTAETLACVLPLGGGEVSVEIASSTRISIRALTSSTAITSGSLGINFLG